MNSPSRPPSIVPRGGVVMLKRLSSFIANPAPAFLALAVVGCSSGPTLGSDIVCGAGTVLVDGVCVAAPDASADANVVDDGGSGDVALETHADGEPDSATVDTSSDVSADTKISDDDECPLTGLDLNCSSTCGGPTSTCASVKCATTTVTNFAITSSSQLPFVMRTPSHPGKDPNCQPRCGPGDSVYGMALMVDVPPVDGYGIRVRVAAPWRISRFDLYRPWCYAGTGSTCSIFILPKPQIVISTTDPNAPSRNIYIDVAKTATSCEAP